MDFGRAALVYLLAALAAAFAAPVDAREMQLESTTCVGGADSLEAAFALPVAELDCGPRRFANQARFVRLHSDLAAQFLPPGDYLLWQTDASSFDSLLLRFSYSDGSSRMVDVDPQMAVRNWFARTRFSVPVPAAAAQLVTLDAVVERPQTYAHLRHARLIDARSARVEHMQRSVVYAIIIGLLFAPITFSLLFYRVLRARFMLWHIAMTAALVLFAASNSGLIFLAFPDLPLAWRFQFNTASLVVAIACAVMFVLGVLEEEAIPTWLARTLLALTIVMLLAKILSAIDLEFWRMTIQTLLLATLVPLAIGILAVIGTALVKRSRAAIFLALAFIGIIFIGLMRLLSALGIIDAFIGIDDALFASMVILVIGTAAAVGDRFMVIRTERDRARTQALKLGRMAHTDGLTGLANRRAFDHLNIVGEHQGLVVVDVDRFKTINDTRGHLVGDAVLCHTASVLRSCFTQDPDSRIFRLGGEEFAIVIDCDDADALWECGEHIRKTIARQHADETLDLPEITVSVGAAMGEGRAASEVFADADAAMFRAKHAGRDRTCVAGLEERMA